MEWHGEGVAKRGVELWCIVNRRPCDGVARLCALLYIARVDEMCLALLLTVSYLYLFTSHTHLMGFQLYRFISGPLSDSFQFFQCSQ